MSGTLRLRGSTSGYSELQAPAVAADQTFVLPTAGGTLLTTDSPVPKLTLELGSASQPSLTFQGDTDTGLFSEGTNTLNLVTGGSSKVVLGAAAHTIYAGTGATVRAIDIDSSGNIGIGQSNPSGKLEVNGGYVTLRSGASSFPDGISAPVIYGSIGGGSGTFDQTGNLVLQTRSDAGNYSICMVTGDTPTERMRIDSSGRLLVQSSSAPSQGVYAQYAPLTVQGYIGSTTGNGILNVARGATASSLISGSDIGTVVFSDSAGGEFGRISCFADAAPDSNDYPGRIGFYTTSDGESSPTERMRIDSAGRMLLGTTTVGVAAGDNLTIEDSSNAGITIRSSAIGAGSILFEDTASDRGEIQYSHNGDFMRFKTAGDEAMRIDSSGRLGLGISSPAARLEVNFTSQAPSGGSTRAGDVFFNNGGNVELAIGCDGSLSNRPTWFQGRHPSGSFDSLRYDISLQPLGGNVGVGTTSPTALLQVGSYSGNNGIQIGAGSGSSSYIHFGDAASGVGEFAGYVQYTHSTNALQFGTDSQEAMRIDADGRLLLGTPSARTDYFNNTLTAMLQVEGTAASGSTSRACVSIVNNNNLTNFETPVLVFGRSRGSTLNSKTLAGSGTRCGHISFQGADGSDMVEAAFIAGEVDGASGANDMPGRLVFSTTQDGNSSPTERMRLDDEGIIYHNSSNHGIGTFLTASAGTEKYAFRGHYGSSAGSYGGNISFTVWSNGNVENTNNSYGAISDIKLKENIVDANSQWNDLKALQVRNYNFIEGQTHTQIGLVAQEVELVSPGLVSESPDVDEEGNDLGTVTKSVNYSVLYMKAVKALQEAMERIETLEQRLSDAGIA